MKSRKINQHRDGKNSMLQSTSHLENVPVADRNGRDEDGGFLGRGEMDWSQPWQWRCCCGCKNISSKNNQHLIGKKSTLQSTTYLLETASVAGPDGKDEDAVIFGGDGGWIAAIRGNCGDGRSASKPQVVVGKKKGDKLCNNQPLTDSSTRYWSRSWRR
jgi:hypothetical protein